MCKISTFLIANPPSRRTAPGEVSEPPAAGRAQISQQRRRKRRRKCWQGQSLRLAAGPNGPVETTGGRRHLYPPISPGDQQSACWLLQVRSTASCISTVRPWQSRRIARHRHCLENPASGIAWPIEQLRKGRGALFRSISVSSQKMLHSTWQNEFAETAGGGRTCKHLHSLPFDQACGVEVAARSFFFLSLLLFLPSFDLTGEDDNGSSAKPRRLPALHPRRS